MLNVILVGLGGALGAMLRYGISLIPFRQGFPIATLLTNLLGAFFIGLLAARAGSLSSRASLLLKTGVCGGFTTFSTFSLEAVSLLAAGRYLAGGAYVGMSLIFCLLGVAAGMYLGSRVPG